MYNCKILNLVCAFIYCALEMMETIYIFFLLQIASAVTIFRNFPALVAKMKPSINSELVISLAKHLSGEKSL